MHRGFKKIPKIASRIATLAARAFSGKRVGAAGRSGRTRTYFNKLTCLFTFIFTIRTPYTVTCSVRSLDMHGFERVSAHKRAVSGANSA
jgi:hypothetical protein